MVLDIGGSVEEIFVGLQVNYRLKPADAIKDAIALYELAVRNTLNGGGIATESAEGDFKSIETPTLSHIRKNMALSKTQSQQQ